MTISFFSCPGIYQPYELYYVPLMNGSGHGSYTQTNKTNIQLNCISSKLNLLILWGNVRSPLLIECDINSKPPLPDFEKTFFEEAYKLVSLFQEKFYSLNNVVFMFSLRVRGQRNA